MSSTVPGRHRAPKHSAVKPVSKVALTLATSAGLAFSTAGAGNAAPAVAAPTATAVPAAVTQSAAAGLASTSVATRILPTRSYITYRQGSRGGSTKTIQRKVGAYADGVFGPRTASKVRSWQRRHGLYADGIVGPKTSRAMGIRLSSKKSSSRGSSSASRSSGRSTSGVINTARRYTGVRYVWAGSTPSSGFDCSGYVTYVFKKAGVNLPRTASQIQRATKRTYSPRPGDLVFHGYPATHVGIYAGNGNMYDSGRSTRGTSFRKIFPGQVSYGRV